MRHRLGSPRVLGALVVAAVAGAAAVLALRASPAPTAGNSGAARPLTVEPSITPASALFGDRVDAVLQVSSVDGRVDPDSVRVETRFAPYVKAAERTTATTEGGVTVQRVRIALDCLGDGCLAPRGGVRVFRFPPAVVAFRLDGEPRTVAVPWGEVRVTSRLERGRRAVLAEEPPQLAADVVFSPGRARVVLAVLAAVLAVLGIWLLLGGLRPHDALVRWRRRRLSPLELALRQLDAAARDDDEATHRRALDLVATRLEEVDTRLEEHSRRLAWERTPPAPDELVTLGEQVRAEVGGARR